MSTRTQPSQRYGVRSLSPAFWYVYDAAKARRERGRGQVGRPHATKAGAERALPQSADDQTHER